MEIRYRVHSVARQSFAVTVPFNGQEVQASVPGLIVELCSEDGTMGHTLRLVPEDMPAAEALFAQDAEVVATFTPVI